jgi:hypothetical protein
MLVFLLLLFLAFIVELAHFLGKQICPWLFGIKSNEANFFGISSMLKNPRQSFNIFSYSSGRVEEKNLLGVC